MELGNEANQQLAAARPMCEPPAQVEDAAPVDLDASDTLVFPHHKRMFAQYRENAAGVTELNLYYGDHEISFDESDLFAFGEGLASHARFVAGDAVTWGAGYPWPRIRELLTELVSMGVLRRADQEPAAVLTRDLNRPSLLPPAARTTPRTWRECEAITRETTGRSLELGYLEMILPPYRSAHVVMDREGRQVGEANVFPKSLRLDIPTEWRSCPHAGSRYQDERPMNVTALKAMRAHWKPMMAALLRIRDSYLQRFPEARGGWTVGDLHCLSAFVLSIPSYLTLRAHDPVGNGLLDPVLSSMYRVTDGVRLVTHHMLFSVELEPTLAMAAPMNATRMLEFAERHRIFHSEYGVCAGPPAMIDEFLQVLLEGRAPEGVAATALPTAIELALDAVEPAFDYALRGLQAYAVWSSRWPAMIRTYERLATALETWSTPSTPAFAALAQRLADNLTFIRTATRSSTEARRERREDAYANMYARSARALGRPDTAPLADAIEPRPVGNDRQACERLRAELEQRLCGTKSEKGSDQHRSELDAIVTALMTYFRQEQAILRVSVAIQQRINTLLGRAPPTRPLTARDLAIHQRLIATAFRPEYLASVKGRHPELTDELEEELGLRVIVRGEHIEIA